MDELSISVEFFFSIDAQFSSEDSLIPFTPSSGQKALLQTGIASVFLNDYLVSLPEGGFVVNYEHDAHLKYYCGQTYLIVKVSDNKNSVSIDPDMRNNIFVQPVTVLCDDLFSLKQFSLSILPPQHRLYAGVNQNVWFKATIYNVGGTVIGQTPDHRANLFLKIYVSPDVQLDIGKDAEVLIVSLDDSIKNRLYGAIETEIQLEGEMIIQVPYSACLEKFMFVTISSGVHVTDIDRSIENNMIHQNISNVIGCAVDGVDVIVGGFTIDSTHSDNKLSFTVIVIVNISGDGELILREDESISFQFFLSADQVYDEMDRSLEFSGKEQVYKLICPNLS